MKIWDALPMPMRSSRGTAINEWFELHKDLDIESFVILDDWNDMGIYRDHFIQINGGIGLTDEDVNEAISFLNDAK